MDVDARDAQGTERVMRVGYERFNFTDDGQYFRVLVLKVGRLRIASYSNRLGLSVWRVRGAKKIAKKAQAPIANGLRVSYN